MIAGSFVHHRRGHCKAEEVYGLQELMPSSPSKSNVKHHKDIASMNVRKQPRAWMIVLSAALAAAGCTESPPAPPVPTPAPTAAAQPLPRGTLGANLVTATARVKALDLQTRQVTLERADGSEVTLSVDDTVRNLPQVMVGDEVTASYHEALAYEVKKPGTATPGATVAEETARAKLGEKPAGAEARVTTAGGTITGIDKAAGTVTLQGPTSSVTPVKARDPRNLERVAVGISWRSPTRRPSRSQWTNLGSSSAKALGR
jgi:Cu/Ag efflux protein CusF